MIIDFTFYMIIDFTFYMIIGSKLFHNNFILKIRWNFVNVVYKRVLFRKIRTWKPSLLFKVSNEKLVSWMIGRTYDIFYIRKI